MLLTILAAEMKGSGSNCCIRATTPILYTTNFLHKGCIYATFGIGTDSKMKKDLMKHITVILGAVLVILLMAAMLSGLTSFRSTSVTDLFNNTTGVAETTANLTLTQPILDGDRLNVTVLSSNITSDAPIAYTYQSATNILNVSGLAASDARRLTVTYRVGSLTAFPGVDIAAKFWPLFIVVGVIGVVVGAIVDAFKGNG